VVWSLLYDKDVMTNVLWWVPA